MRRLLTAAALVSGLALGGANPSTRSTSCRNSTSWARRRSRWSAIAAPVFPEGVPGVAQGVPPELVKGYQPPPETPPPVVAAKPEKSKPKPKKTVAVQRKPRPQPQAAATAAAAAGAGRADHDHAAGGPERGRRRRPCPARSRPGRPTHRLRPAPGPARSANLGQARLYRPRTARLIRLIPHDLHTGHCRAAECRQVDAVQPAGRQAARDGRRQAGRDARPARGRRRSSAISPSR